MWKHWPEAVCPTKTECRPLEKLWVGVDISRYLPYRETGIVGDAADGPQPWMLARKGPHNLAPTGSSKGVLIVLVLSPYLRAYYVQHLVGKQRAFQRLLDRVNLALLQDDLIG